MAQSQSRRASNSRHGTVRKISSRLQWMILKKGTSLRVSARHNLETCVLHEVRAAFEQETLL